MHTTTDGPRAEAQHDKLVAAVGASYFPLALVARLPYAMMVVGVLTLVVAGRGSIALGGLNSAVAGVGTAVVGPLIGAAVDRFGQRRVLLLVSALNCLALLAIAWVVYSPLPTWSVLLVALLVGATAPQVGPMSRSRLVGIIGTRIRPVRRSSVFQATMAYESGADESVFVFGPVIVGLLATGVSPAAPVVGAAVLTGVFVTGFALHPSARVADHADSGTADAVADPPAPVRELLRARLVVVVTGVLGIGLVFGTVLTSLTAFTDDAGQPESAGLYYGILGVGSAVLALASGRFPTTFRLHTRLIVFGLVLATATVLYGIAGSTGAGLALVVVGLALGGIGIGPLLVSQFSLGSLRSPHRRSATVMTMLGSAVMVGQAGSSAITGAVSDLVGTTAAMWCPVAAGAVVVVSALVNRRLSTRE